MVKMTLFKQMKMTFQTFQMSIHTQLLIKKSLLQSIYHYVQLIIQLSKIITKDVLDLSTKQIPNPLKQITHPNNSHDNVHASIKQIHHSDLSKDTYLNLITLSQDQTISSQHTHELTTNLQTQASAKASTNRYQRSPAVTEMRFDSFILWELY